MRKRIITMTSMKKNKVILGLSGGVDSTAAALILAEKGFDVTGLYFDVTPEAVREGTGRKQAEQAAKQLGVDLIYRDVSRDFEEIVIGNFRDEYARARTPNPCIVCNPLIKFRTLLEAADSAGAYHIATGHYAGTFRDDETGTWYIKKAVNARKDQSYMLYRLGQEVISRLLLPLDHVEDKEQVREMARARALKNSDARDSQEICFIDEKDNYKDFLRRRGVKPSPGNFVDAGGNVLGRHDGILNFTIGQRKGLGIALGKPAFVTAIDSESDEVVLGDNEDLFKREIFSEENLLVDEKYLGDSGITAKIRYAAKPASVRLERAGDGRIRACFDEPQRAATPGQSIVFYKGDLVIGGGFITAG